MESIVYETSDSVLSLQELIKEPITVPQRYVRVDLDPPSLSPNNNSPFAKIPTIDMNKLIIPGGLELEKLHSACKEWGLFQLVNHGISSLLEKLKHELEEFYKLPLEEKMKYKIRPGDFQGYGAMARTGRNLDWGDRFYMITNPIHRRKPYLLPELPSSVRNTLETYFLELQNLAMKLFGFIAKNLKMEWKEMEELFEDGMQSVRMTYYPPCPQPELVMGFGPHSDATGITILNQVNGIDGLQIKKDGVWLPVSFLPDALVVNVGDILEILSNGVYHSIEHRVAANSERERISIAFFVNPKLEAEIGPAISLTNPKNPPKFKKVSMEKYVNDYFSRKLIGKSYLETMKIIPNEEEPITT